MFMVSGHRLTNMPKTLIPPFPAPASEKESVFPTTGSIFPQEKMSITQALISNI